MEVKWQTNWTQAAQRKGASVPNNNAIIIKKVRKLSRRPPFMTAWESESRFADIFLVCSYTTVCRRQWPSHPQVRMPFLNAPLPSVRHWRPVSVPPDPFPATVFLFSSVLPSVSSNGLIVAAAAVGGVQLSPDSARSTTDCVRYSRRDFYAHRSQFSLFFFCSGFRPMITEIWSTCEYPDSE